VNSKSQNINASAQLWSLTGPLLIACILAIVALRPGSMNWQLSLVALSGLVLTYKWAWRGVLASSAILAIVLLLISTKGSPVDLLWMITLSLSILSAFVVTVLSQEQALSDLEQIYQETECQRSEYDILQENIRIAQINYLEERVELQTCLESTKNELAIRETKLQASDRLIVLVRDELSAMHKQHEKLLQELFEARQKKRECDVTVQNDAKFNELQDLISLKDQEFQSLKVLCERICLERDQAHQQIARENLELSSLREQQQLIETQTSIAQSEQLRQQAVALELRNNLDMLTMEKNLLENTLSRLQVELESLTAQKQQQNQLLESHQATLCSLKDVSDRYEADLIKERQNSSELKTEFDAKTLFLKRQLDESAQQWVLQLQATQRKSEELLLELEAIQSKYQAAVAHEADLQEQILEMSIRTKELATVHNSLEAMQNKYNQTQVSLHELEQQLAENRQSGHEASQHEVRRLEGLYKQLREQFVNKSATLDATRKELFVTQENLLALKKDMEELQLYEAYESDKHLVQVLGSLENELEREPKNEASQLHELINKLMREDSKASR